MPSELVDWIYDYLERDDDIVVPVKKMWNDWHTAHVETSLPDFTAAVLDDERVEQMGGVDHTEGMDWMNPEELAEYERDMEQHDFYSGPRVKLKSRPVTLEHIAQMIKKHNDRLEAALQQARQAMPDDVSEQEEGALIDIIAKTQELRERLREAGLEPDEDEGEMDQASDPSDLNR